MQTINSNPVTETDASSFINDSVNKLDEQRLAGLQDFQQQQSFRNSILQQEKTRLEAKYGTDHPLVQKLDTRISMQVNLNTGLDQEISKASIKNEPFNATSWRLHGKVYDGNNKPVQGVTVYLGDAQGIWDPGTGTSCSDETGYYSLTLDVTDPKPGTNARKRLIKAIFYLCVSDKNRNLVYQGRDAWLPASGIIEYKDILLNSDVCTPPASPEKKKAFFGKSFWRW